MEELPRFNIGGHPRAPREPPHTAVWGGRGREGRASGAKGVRSGARHDASGSREARAPRGVRGCARRDLARDEHGSVTCNGRNAPGNPGNCRARAASRAGDSGTVGERGSGRAGRVAMTGSAAVSPRKAQTWLGHINPYLVDVFGPPTHLYPDPNRPPRDPGPPPEGGVGGPEGEGAVVVGQMRPAPLGGERAGRVVSFGKATGMNLRYVLALRLTGLSGGRRPPPRGEEGLPHPGSAATSVAPGLRSRPQFHHARVYTWACMA